MSPKETPMLINRIVKLGSSALKKSMAVLKALIRFWLPVYVLTEADSPAKKPPKLIYAGYSSAQRKYMAQRLFGRKTYTCRLSGVDFFWHLKSRRRRLNLKADVLIAEASFLTIGFFLKSEGYVMPELIDMKIDIRQPMEVMKRRKGSDFSDVERLIRKYHWNYSVTREAKAYHDFFFNMHLPYIKLRYPGRAIIPTFRQFQESCRSSFLIHVHRDDSPLAGIVVVIDQGHPSLHRLGIRGGNTDYLKQGVIGAMYYFAILESQKMGYGELWLGGTYPFLSDGLTKYKMRLNGEFILNDDRDRNHLWVFSGNSESARNFFRQNPFICVGRDGKLRKTVYS